MSAAGLSADRFAEVPEPGIPPATSPCHFDPEQLCNSDEETAEVIGGLAAALAEANRKLRWLADFLDVGGE